MIIKDSTQKVKNLEIKRKLKAKEAIVEKQLNHLLLTKKIRLRVGLVIVKKPEKDANSFFLLQNL
jgi:hypothetical protein